MAIQKTRSRSDRVQGLLAILNESPPEFSEIEAKRLLQEHYGLKGELSPLGSERDQNFLVTTSENEKRLLKFSNPVEEPEVTNFQTGAFLHVQAKDPGVSVSRVLPTLEGEYEISALTPDGQRSILRLFSWLEGTAMIDIPEDQRPFDTCQQGYWLARIAQALEDFTHPGMNHPLLYDVRLVECLEPLLQFVDDRDLRRVVLTQLRNFRRRVKMVLENMPSHVIFNDMSPRNYIVDPKNPEIFRGFIDFGDMINGPRIIDIAVACNYLVQSSQDPLCRVARFLEGYHRLSPLTVAELEVLRDVMLCRTVIQILIYHWRASIFPENRKYILQNLPQLRKTIACMEPLDRQTVLAQFTNACGLPQTLSD